MNRECNQNKIKLVSSRSIRAPLTKSELAKPKLTLIDKSKRRQLHILIGDHQHNIGYTAVAGINFLIKDKYELKVMTALFAKELLRCAQDYEFDIFIPIINNILFSSAKLPVEKRVEKALKLITHFKGTYKKPIIAFFGWPNDPAFAEKARQAGANYAFKMPYKTEDFREAVMGCLDKIV